MSKLIFLLLGLLFAFYVVWPAWSGYRIYEALENDNASTLERKVDFPSVRESLKPAIRARVDKLLERAPGDAGRLRDGRLRQQIGPQLMEAVLNRIVTPQSIASLYAWRGDISQVIKNVKEIREIRTATDEADIAESHDKPPALRLSNIKRFAFTSPTSFEIGIAKDASASEPDLTAQMGFTGMDWKLTGLVPKVEGAH